MNNNINIKIKGQNLLMVTPIKTWSMRMLNHYCNVNKCVCEERETWKEREGERNETSTAQLECPYMGIA